MAVDLEQSVRRAAESVAKYVADAATLTVQTSYVEIESHGSSDLNEAKLAAKTTIKLDGDSGSVIPMRQSSAGGTLEIDTQLYDLHQENVEKAIAYRAKMMQAMLGVFQSVSRRR